MSTAKENIKIISSGSLDSRIFLSIAFSVALYLCFLHDWTPLDTIRIQSPITFIQPDQPGLGLAAIAAGAKPDTPRVATAAPRRAGPQVGEGFYFHQGQVVKVERSDRGGYLFARIVTGAKFLKAPKGMLYRITPDEEMTPEAVAAYGVQHEVCCNCATKLSDPVSKKVGLGTKCGPDLLGSDSYKAARKAAEAELATANDDLVAHFTA